MAATRRGYDRIEGTRPLLMPTRTGPQASPRLTRSTMFVLPLVAVAAGVAVGEGADAIPGLHPRRPRASGSMGLPWGGSRIRRQQQLSSITIDSSMSAAAIDDYIEGEGSAVVVGDVSISGGTITTAQLTALLQSVVSVTGSVSLNGVSTAATLSMPALRTVGGNVYINNCRRLSGLSLVNLTSVGGSLTLQSLPYLTGGAVSAGLPELRSVTGRLYMNYISWRGTQARSGLVLPELRTVGSWSTRQSMVSVVSCPLLAAVTSGAFTWYYLPNVHGLDFPSLSLVAGRITMARLDVLANLCHFTSLQPGRYRWHQPISIQQTAHLVEVPEWMAANASLIGTRACSGLPAVVIATATDFARVSQNLTLMAATSLGPVVIAWPGMSTANLTAVLRGKTALGGLVLTLTPSITTLSPALDNLTAVSGGVVVDNCGGLTQIEMPALATVGGGVRLFSLARLRSVAMPELTSIGGLLYLYNMHAVLAVDFESLRSVNASLYLQYMRHLSGDDISNGFPNLEAVNGTLFMRYVSMSGPQRGSPITLPQLRSVGAWFMQQLYVTAVACPELQTIGGPGAPGTFTWQIMHALRTMHFPSLSLVTGRIRLDRVYTLLNLCHIGLQPTGYSGTTIYVRGAPNLVAAPAWMAENASLSSTTTACSGHPGLLIASAVDYARFLQNSTLLNAAELGSVVITWNNMTNARLVRVFQNKTSLGGLVLALLPSVTTLSPALDNVTRVDSGIVLDNLRALLSAEMPSLTYCGSGVRVYDNGRLLSIRMPRLVTAQNVFLARLYALRSVSLVGLRTVNGSFTVYHARYLSPYALSNGLPSLQSVSGTFSIDFVAWISSLYSRGPINLPQLQSVGRLNLRRTFATSLSFDGLQVVGGDVLVRDAPYLKALHMDSLHTVNGSISFATVPRLSNLCHLGSPGGQRLANVTVSGGTDLVEAPQWVATSASLNVSACSGHPAVVIHTLEDFNSYMQNSSLRDATELGQVVITWGAITNAQFSSIFQNKTILGGLMVEGCRAISTLSPGLDNLTIVRSGLMLDNLASLTTAELASLTFVGGGVRIFTNPRLVAIAMPRLVTSGSIFIYNCATLRSVPFLALQSVNGTLTLLNLRYLSPAAISNGFPSLQSVTAQFRLDYAGRWPSGYTALTPISLPQLRTVGAWLVRNLRVSSISCPALTSVGGAGQTGTFTWARLPDLRAVHLPSLTVVSGRISFTTVPSLSTLCPLGNLHPSGYQATQPAVITGAADLVSLPAWLARNASINGTIDCTGLPSVVISSEDDFNAYVANTTLRDTTQLGPVIVTWTAINDAQLVVVLQNKTSVGGLVIEGCRSITTLSPALDNLTTISSGLVLDYLLSLSRIELQSLSRVGASVRLYRNPRVTTISLPLVQTLGSLFIDSSAAVRVVAFQNLTTVNGSITLQNMQYLTGTAITNGFPNLQTVVGTLRLNVVSWRGDPARSPLSLPQLRAVGGVYIRQSHFTSISCAALTNVGGPTELHDFGGRGELGIVYLYYLPNLRGVHFESLRLVSGRISIIRVSMLTTLCGLAGLQPTGYHSRYRISMSSAPDLVRAPQWLARNASFPGTAECANHPLVVIHSAADYNHFLQNLSLMGATTLGQVVITWPQISMDQLAIVLQNKTTLGGLVLEGCNEIARLSPALDNITTITSGLVLDNLVALTATQLTSLRHVGGGLRIYRNRRMTHISAEALETTGGLFLFDLGRMIDASFDNLVSVNGSLSVTSTAALSGTAVSNAFPRLQRVLGQLKLQAVSWSGPTARSSIILPVLQTVGALYVRQLAIVTFSTPALTMVGGAGQPGAFYWYYLPRLTTINAPALRIVTGRMTFSRLSVMTSVCTIGLDRTGYYGSQPVSSRCCATPLLFLLNGCTLILSVPTLLRPNSRRATL
mmetsp:Transcript_31795/g.95555  ORF Transcript_31795/g.95555 Transcript_31795/m.95555 type:complete len:1899 (+) Transcript_31795:340-6036(+)